LNKDLNELKDYFDFSNYPRDHPLYDTIKKKVPGYFKDELAGEEMTEFIALRSKMYAYKMKELESSRPSVLTPEVSKAIVTESESKKLKGISKNVVKRDITFDDYVDCLEKSKSFNHKMRHLISEKHQIYLEEVDKKSLSPFDDKRFILDDGVTTIPFGMI
uniref:hypothetical protein n=1 Tax=Bartonella sp. CL41QHWL TaxID=3243527 RepID=UPI0035D08594